MKPVQVRAHSDADAAALWRAASEFDRHTAYFPLTRVSVTQGAGDRVGDRIEGLTVVGPLRLADPMTITTYDAPHHYTVRKTGEVLAGTVDVLVSPQGTGSEVVWTAQVAPARRWLARLGAPVNALVSRAVYQHAVNRMARTAERIGGG